MKVLKKYAYRTLKRKSAEVKRRVILPDPDKINKVGILWRPSEKNAYLYLHSYFSQKRVIFRNLCIDIENKNVAGQSNIISPKDLNWLGFPKSGICDDFIRMEFDLLMNIALEQNPVLDYITGLSIAKFKTGWSPAEDNFFDLNIKINEKQDALFLAKQQIFYLGQLNIKA
jgi:hypothetical protein